MGETRHGARRVGFDRHLALQGGYKSRAFRQLWLRYPASALSAHRLAEAAIHAAQ